MAYDGLMTRAIVRELNDKIALGKIEKIYQPETDQLVILVHSKNGNFKLLASVGSSHSRVHFIEEALDNPQSPPTFCMVLRKHLSGARITDISQHGTERIIEISMETLNELGFTVSKKLIFEIMGKHSNISLIDLETGKIIDCIKHVSFGESRVRQLLPGLIYQYPPKQDKIDFTNVTLDDFCGFSDKIDLNSQILEKINGISPNFATELANFDKIDINIDDSAQFSEDNLSNSGKYMRIFTKLFETISSIDENHAKFYVYLHESDPKEYYLTKLSEFDESCECLEFNTASECLEYYYSHKETSNQTRQKSNDLAKSVSNHLDKMYLKKKRLSEDLLKAENSENLRIYGELLTANLHLVKAGMKSVDVINYYDGKTVSIPLDPKSSPQKNAQQYFKRYNKSKTAIKEKQIQLEDNQKEIDYLESVLACLMQAESVSEIDAIRLELVETGYLRPRKLPGGYKEKKAKFEPLKFTLSNGMTALVGRNNNENDHLTFKMASKTDLWFHTKDIPGSHVVVFTNGIDIAGFNDESQIDEKAVFEAASLAAYHSKSRNGENIPVDYVPVRYVKKPAGSKPGFVIFTNNRTVYTNPSLPKKS